MNTVETKFNWFRCKKTRIYDEKIASDNNRIYLKLLIFGEVLEFKI